MDWDDVAPDWDDDPMVRAYSEAAFESLLEIAAHHGVDLADLDVCDFGCGTGLLTESLAPQSRHVDAIDVSPAMLAVLDAKIEHHGWMHVTTMREIPSPLQGDARYDLIVCSSVCSFLDDYPATARQLVELLRPGGLFVQWDWELDPSDDEPHGLTRRDMSAALTAAGLLAVSVDVGFEVQAGDDIMAPLRGVGRRPGVQEADTS